MGYTLVVQSLLQWQALRFQGALVQQWQEFFHRVMLVC